MTPQRYERARELFFAACEREPQERERLLREAESDDPDLASRVRVLLERDASATDFLREPDTTAQWLRAALAEPQTVPAEIGGYRIIRKIAEGGMGTVYEAEQAAPRRTVALKVLRQPLASSSLMRRFEHESQMLALLQHPGIAQVFEAGTADTPFGQQPFLAMELIQGLPLLGYAAQLAIRQRLLLIIKICEAVQHAHQKGIIHRDLKPANILVVPAEHARDVGQPKILDFGVARATGTDGQVTHSGTHAGQLIGTLAYMSPEQTTGLPDLVDTRSDIYSLGVIAYELLAGSPPYELRGLTLAEAIRRIQEHDAPTLAPIRASYGGDLDTIVRKAMSKEREHRYATASAFSDDIRKYLDDQPISARAPSRSYYIRKFARRHRTFVAGTLAATVLLVLGTTGTLLGLVLAIAREKEAVEAREQSDLSRDEAELVTRIFEQAIASVSPDELGRDVLVRDVLAEVERSMTDEPGLKPHLEARLRHTLGTAYTSLDAYESATSQLKRALHLRRSSLGVDHLDTLRTALALGSTQLRHEVPQGRSLLEEAHSIAQSVLPPQDPISLELAMWLGKAHMLSGDLSQAERVLVTAVASAAVSSPLRIDLQGDLAGVYRAQGRYADAERTLDEAQELAEQFHIASDLPTRGILNDLAMLYDEQGRFAEAERTYINIIERTVARVGPDHRESVVVLSNLGLLYTKMGRFVEAEPILADVLGKNTSRWGQRHILTLTSMNNLALLYDAQGRYEDAEPLWTNVAEAISETLGERHPHTLVARNNLATLYRNQGRLEESERLFIETLALLQETLAPDHQQTLRTMYNLAKVHRLQGRLDEAETALVHVLEKRRSLLGDDHFDTLLTINELGLVYLAQQRTDEAATMLLEAVQRGRDTQHARLGTFLTAYGRLLTQQGRLAEAEATLLEALERVQAKLKPTHVDTQDCLRAIIALYEGMERPEEARRYQAQLDSGTAPADSSPADMTVASDGATAAR